MESSVTTITNNKKRKNPGSKSKHNKKHKKLINNEEELEFTHKPLPTEISEDYLHDQRYHTDDDLFGSSPNEASAEEEQQQQRTKERRINPQETSKDSILEKIKSIKSVPKKKRTIKIIEDINDIDNIKSDIKSSNQHISKIFQNRKHAKKKINNDIQFFNDQIVLREEFLDNLKNVINNGVELKHTNWNKKFEKIKNRLTSKTKINELKSKSKHRGEEKSKKEENLNHLVKNKRNSRNNNLSDYEILFEIETRQMELMNLMNYIIKFIEGESRKNKNELFNNEKFKKIIENFTNDTINELNKILEENFQVKQQLNDLNATLVIEKSVNLNEKLTQSNNGSILKTNLFNLHRTDTSEPIKKVFKKKGSKVNKTSAKSTTTTKVIKKKPPPKSKKN